MGHEIAPFSAVLLRSESAASSRIENLTASARAIAEAQLGDRSRRNASLIVANEQAMRSAISLADQIDADSILAMHRALLERDVPEIAGRWRDRQVWIGGSYVGPHQAMFIPPQHTRVTAAIADLLAFIDRDDIAVLAHAAIAHAQFETIHPFPDGNGRTGRALVHAQLRNKGLTRNVTVPISAGLLTDTDGYFAALTSYRDGNLVPIVQAFARAAFLATNNGRHLASDINDIRARWRDEIKVRSDATAWRIVDLLVRQPVITASFIADRTGIAPQNAYRALRPLLDAGVVVEFTNRRRGRMWRAPEVLDALDQFAARAGARSAPRS
ncbi:MAG TPA: Fic family protein [Microthrixaceae bacterium]|nr:Fic family protein [Microthrixaceae bacterium]